MVELPMTLSNPNPQFQGHPIVEGKYLADMTSHRLLSNSWVNSCWLCHHIQ